MLKYKECELGNYLLFYGSRFYPGGGWHDFKGSFGEIPEAVSFLESCNLDKNNSWWHIVDSSTDKIIAGEYITLWGEHAIFDENKKEFVLKDKQAHD